MRIAKNQTIAIAVDVQERLFPHIFEHDKLEENLLRLIPGLRALDIPIIVTEQYTKGLGVTIPSIREALGDNYAPVEKLSFSCCGVSPVMDQLARAGKKNVILFGIETHVCVLQTALDLAQEGYRPVVIDDCVSSRKPNDKRVALERMRQSGAVVSTYESILFEMCVNAGTDQFKAVSKLVK